MFKHVKENHMDGNKSLPKMCPTNPLRNKKNCHRQPTEIAPGLCRTFGAEAATLETLHRNMFFSKMSTAHNQ